MTKFSVLDLAPVREGGNPGDALRNSRDLAQHAEALGYERYWLAEHHNMVGIASAATSVAIGYVAEGTKSIRVGAGGVMLPNHSPLVIAEHFGTLASLYPGRIDLGLGRAPGTDQQTLRALRRSPMMAENFPQDVLELQALLGPVQEGQFIQAVPGADTNVPLWILGSSLFGAQLAAMLGLPYAFASHFAPEALFQALDVYRENFKPSEQLSEPYAMVGMIGVGADTEEEAKRLFTTPQQQSINLFRGTRGRLRPPIDDIEDYWSPAEKMRVTAMQSCAFVGTAESIPENLAAFIERTQADELMIASSIFDHQDRVHSYEIFSQVRRKLGGSHDA
ncbi:MAG: LLM class flavin-dependent oxidoreductase [Rhodospirillaceae bacterium]|mgnify:CR=1 FL=1|nr:LLM class flavin-dependent oxidoreductase [Rhodospirillaceae bacterium]MBT5192832.1 LLM class flavin-dependent oxidoreductase [Rhodospirillaceae bacterium]MBT5896750.1 LLM class flavin-dependent oxidoreductase [Rhodospirillaceae bacterium]MBT6431015.1 LLM class flavin-dependent oxidoreductase [Rhodospirillaceae bacterium]MBT7756787.1 LLM class flavin-dependent oxidoreductase [Rhodospirillaceae bacterium]